VKNDNQPVIKLEKWLAEIVCKKGSYELFQKTLAKDHSERVCCPCLTAKQLVQVLIKMEG